MIVVLPLALPEDVAARAIDAAATTRTATNGPIRSCRYRRRPRSAMAGLPLAQSSPTTVCACRHLPLLVPASPTTHRLSDQHFRKNRGQNSWNSHQREDAGSHRPTPPWSRASTSSSGVTTTWSCATATSLPASARTVRR